MHISKIIVFSLFLATLSSCAPATGAQDDGIVAGQLTCFPIASPSVPMPELASADMASSSDRWIKGATCDDMCAARGAACTSVDMHLGAFSCATLAEAAVCRCCTIAR